jgi:hypothetical protein
VPIAVLFDHLISPFVDGNKGSLVQASYIAEIWTDCTVVVRSLKVIYATF